MPAPRPPYVPGEHYHIYNRGAHRLAIFREPDNYLYVLRKLKEHAAALRISILAYCLLPNHYHLLVRQDGDSPSGLLPQLVFNAYSKAYNKRFGLSGTLFQGSYRVIRIQEESHLLHLCRYIHANPVRHGLVADPSGWPYSNYLEWIGQREGTLIDRAFVMAHFPTPESYGRFVADGMASDDLPVALERLLGEFEE